MPAERRFGMDHEHYDWSPLNTRGVLRWPENARVALCVIVNLEHMEWTPPQESYTSPLAGGLEVWPESPARRQRKWHMGVAIRSCPAMENVGGLDF